MDLDDGISSYSVPLPTYMSSEVMTEISVAEMEAFRCWAANLLSNQTIYDILPVSSKVSIIDGRLPVEQAFHIMYEEGLAVVPISDEDTSTITGMLTASDFILILRELHNNIQLLASGELEMPSVFAWKKTKVQNCMIPNGTVGNDLQPLIQVSDQECLRNVAMKILQYEISAIPIFKTSLQDSSFTQLVNVAELPQILKYICCYLGDAVRSIPFLQHPICRFPLGTWLDSGRGSGRPLTILRYDSSLSSTLNLLLEAGISAVPIVDGNGSLVDVYSRRDILSLAKDDMYSRLQLTQMTVIQALELVYQAYPLNNGRRRCHICSQATPFCDVLKQLSDPAVRRVVVVDPTSQRVEGIISLRDVAKFILG